MAADATPCPGNPPHAAPQHRPIGPPPTPAGPAPSGAGPSCTAASAPPAPSHAGQCRNHDLTGPWTIGAAIARDRWAAVTLVAVHRLDTTAPGLSPVERRPTQCRPGLADGAPRG